MSPALVVPVGPILLELQLLSGLQQKEYGKAMARHFRVCKHLLSSFRAFSLPSRLVLLLLLSALGIKPRTGAC